MVKLSGYGEVKRLAEIRLMSRLEERAALASAKEYGKKKGLEEGKKKGLEEGEKKGAEKSQREIAQKLLKLKIPLEKVIEATGISKEELEKMNRK